MISDCTALILAGGDSRRMGRDKANVLLDQKTLLQHVISSMKQIFPEVIVSVRNVRDGLDLSQICDEQSGAGPLAGIVAGLAQIATPWAFVVACDMPYVKPDVVELLGAFRGSHQAVVPVIGGYPQPLAAFYAGSCVDVMRACLSRDDKSLRGALKQLDVCYVDEAELSMADPSLRSFVDLDTPQDLAAALNGVK
jgi:molybdopterin-guanine dinucleotide biosynthesis protein A